MIRVLEVVFELGRKVTGFSQSEWDKISRGVMIQASEAKYRQNKSLRDALVGTKGTVLVEASPYDCVWGIGLSRTDVRSNDHLLWKGANRLGFLLSTLRDNLIKEPVSSL